MTEPLEKRVALRNHVVNDQGNGSSYCSHCNSDLGSNPSKQYDSCPGCGYKLVEGDLSIEQGGSDF